LPYGPYKLAAFISLSADFMLSLVFFIFLAASLTYKSFYLAIFFYDSRTDLILVPIASISAVEQQTYLPARP
jgi:hypothetical protein